MCRYKEKEEIKFEHQEWCHLIVTTVSVMQVLFQFLQAEKLILNEDK